MLVKSCLPQSRSEAKVDMISAIGQTSSLLRSEIALNSRHGDAAEVTAVTTKQLTMEKIERRLFREGVFRRDDDRCVICGIGSRDGHDLDAHHILERRLWEDGGYHIDNGATLCEEHHILAEQTVLSCEELRAAAGITNVVLPAHLYADQEIRYTKWGDIINPDRTRTPGELFHDDSVQKVLREGGMLPLYLETIKYPRTLHLPWSNPSKDDVALSDVSIFEGQEVVVILKLDGENSNLYRRHIHARSIKPLAGAERSHILALHFTIAHEIPEGWRLCVENLASVHSIEYDSSIPYAMLFSIWNERNECLSWDLTVEWAQLLGVPMVPVLYRGVWNEKLIRSLYQPQYKGNEMEGYVVRLAASFPYSKFRRSVAKYVREGFIAGRHYKKGTIRQIGHGG